MDALSFIAEITKAVAWPAAAIAFVLLLRSALIDLIPTLRRLKYKDLELEFGEKLDQVVAKAEQARLPAPEEAKALPIPTPTPSSDLEVVAGVSPRAAVIEAYRRVEVAANDALRREGVQPPRSPRALRQVLESKGIVTGSTGALLDDLRGLRNLAAHADEFSLTPSQATDYAQLSRRLVSAINVSSTGPDT